jgi:ABC-type transporter Mla maintaining outer membrane lipid asymmetry permease subunit MlaE
MGLTGLITFVAGLGLLVDMAGWWITRDFAPFAYAVVVGGGIYSAGTSLLGLMIIVDCLLPGGKRSIED